MKDLTKIERIGAHSHIKGLGIDSQLQPLQSNTFGIVGQFRARRALGIILRIIQSSSLAGRAIILTGPPGTGKTALALALAKELGEEVPFVTISASEVYSKDLSKTEVLTQALRRSVGVKIKEEGEVIEGEVVEIQVDRSYTGVVCFFFFFLNRLLGRKIRQINHENY